MTFETGGSPEIPDDKCGIVVAVDDVEELKNAIIKVKEERPFSKESCVVRGSIYDERIKFLEYLKLYKELTKNN